MLQHCKTKHPRFRYHRRTIHLRRFLHLCKNGNVFLPFPRYTHWDQYRWVSLFVPKSWVRCIHIGHISPTWIRWKAMDRNSHCGISPHPAVSTYSSQLLLRSRETRHQTLFRYCNSDRNGRLGYCLKQYSIQYFGANAQNRFQCSQHARPLIRHALSGLSESKYWRDYPCGGYPTSGKDHLQHRHSKDK